MPYPIQPNWSAADFKREIFDHYFTDHASHTSLQAKIDGDAKLNVTSKAKLIDDYCTLGSFFAANSKVLTALIALERAIRTELERAARRDLQQKIQTFKVTQAKQGAIQNSHNEAIYFKTDKLLSGVLTTAENLAGFNNFEKETGKPLATTDTLHSQATIGVKDRGGLAQKTGMGAAGFQMTPGGRTDKVNLPHGVPGLTGGVGGIDFNRILLRHAYHWKDVGAGALGHGEYTHRIQWYAVTANYETSDDLKLTNTPLQIFKSMGSLWARSTYPLKIEQEPERKTYVWEALFDCFKNSSSRTDGSIAYSNGTYNCPDNLNSELIKAPETLTFNPDDPSNLFCLRVLTNARNFKRTKAAQIDPLRRLMEDRKNVTEVFRQENKDAYLVWYLTK